MNVDNLKNNVNPLREYQNTTIKENANNVSIHNICCFESIHLKEGTPMPPVFMFFGCWVNQIFVYKFARAKNSTTVL